QDPARREPAQASGLARSPGPGLSVFLSGVPGDAHLRRLGYNAPRVLFFRYVHHPRSRPQPSPGPVQGSRAAHMRNRLGVLALALLLAVPAAADTAAPSPSVSRWVRTDETVVPIRADISRNGEIRGFLRKGQVVAVERSTEHWVKIRANDTLEGWVP